MPRTATHQRKRHLRAQAGFCLPLTFTVSGLRRPRGRAAQPERIDRRIRYDRIESVLGRPGVAGLSRQQERGARAAARLALGRVVQVAGGPGGLAAAADLDVAPYRPRHRACWEAV